MRRFAPSVVLVGVIVVLLFAAPIAGTACPLPLGTNLAGPRDYGAEYPWVDIMTCARQWITHNEDWIDGGVNAWDTGYLAQIPRDDHGYPLELPVTIAGAEDDQIVRTVWANTGKLPAGTWTVLWDGTGALDVWGDVADVVAEAQRLSFTLIPQDGGILALELRHSQSGDHLHNIRVLMPGTEGTHESDEWSTAWLDKLAPFGALRFMDWGLTNNSPLSAWSDRTELGDYTYTVAGVPYERWVEVCNRLDRDAWVCVPHLADDDYVRRMARLFRDGLEPDRTIYLEYSNELWNWMFSQTHHCHDAGDQQVPWPERIAPFIQRVFDLWREEFGAEADRLVRVVGVQASYQDVSNRIVASLDPDSFDAFAPAAYFHFTGEGIATLEQLGAAATADTVISLARDGLLEETLPWLRTQLESIGDVYGIPMLYYEGGQHLTPQPFGSEQPYGAALVAAQTHPGMGDLYRTLLDSLTQLASAEQPGLFMNFSYITGTSARYGTWGVLQHQFLDQPAPKYDALEAYACQQGTSSPGGELPGARGAVLDPPAPNPFNAGTTLRYRLAAASTVDLAVYDLAGRHVRTLLRGHAAPAGEHTAFWDGRSSQGRPAAAGVYLGRITTPAGSRSVRMCLVK